MHTQPTDLEEGVIRKKTKESIKTKTNKNKLNHSREITDFFTKVQRPNSNTSVNVNIPTPNKAALQQLDLEYLQLCSREQHLLKKSQQKVAQVYTLKQQNEAYLSKIKQIAGIQIKKDFQIRRFFKKQIQLKWREKQLQLQQVYKKINNYKYLSNQCSNHQQLYFLKKSIQNQQTILKQISLKYSLFQDQKKLIQEETHCILAKIQWPLINRRYQSLQLLGKGGFSQVYRCYDIQTGHHVALKLSSFDQFGGVNLSKQYIKHTRRQYMVHKHLNHPNIVKLLQVFQIDSALCIVLQFCQGQTLAKMLKKQKKLQQHQAKMIAYNILKVISYLNSKNPAIIHYDLKPQNIIFHQGTLKVLDFGICKALENDQSKMALTSQQIGTYFYLPPQIFVSSSSSLNTPIITSKVDIWSLGIIFYQMIYGKRPFQAVSLDYQLQIDLNVLISENGVDFLKKCLNPKVQQRLDPEQALRHKYFQSM